MLKQFISAFYLCVATSCLAWQCAQSSRPVTVKDAIEMTRLGVAAYQDDTASNVARFSPDGKRFVVVLKKGDLGREMNRYELLVYRTDQALDSQKIARSLQFWSGSNREAIKGVKWLKDNRTLMFIGEQSGSAQIYSLDVGSGAIKRLTHHQTPIVLFDSNEDGSVLVYEAEPKQGDPLSSPSVKRNGLLVSSQDLADVLLSATPSTYLSTRNGLELFLQKKGESARRIETEDGVAANLGLSVAPNGHYALIETWVHNIPSAWLDYKDRVLHGFIAADRAKGSNALVEHYLMLNTTTGRIYPLLDAPKSWQHDGFQWINGGDAIVLSRAYLPLTNVDRDEREKRTTDQFAVEVNPRTHEIKKIVEGPLLAEEWSEEKKELVLSSKNREGMSTQVSVWRRGPGEWSPLRTAVSKKREALPAIRYVQDLNMPPILTITDSTTKLATTLLDLNPSFKNLCFAHEEQIDFFAKDGHPVRGGLYLPPGYQKEKRYPLVIQTHAFDPHRFWIDGPWSSAFAAQPLAARGIVVLQMGGSSDGSDSSFRSSPMEAPRQMAAFEGAVDYLDRIGVIDRNRVGIIGFSRTGYHVAYTLTHSNYHWAAATLADCFTGGYFAQLAFKNQVSEPNAVNGGPPFGSTLDDWLVRSPSFQMSNLKTPVRLESYGLPSAIEQWEWFSQSAQLKKPVDFVVLPRGVHILVRPSDRLVSQQGNVDWFDFWLNGRIGPTSSNTDQVKRWEHMRLSAHPGE